MIITENLLNEKVPTDNLPTRLDSAINLYTNIKNKGLILYNIKPDTWNCLYPFFETNHKFTLNKFEFSKRDITYGELIKEYEEQYHKIYEIDRKYDKTKRIETLVSEYKKTFNLQNIKIDGEMESCYEIKYSKSQNVWTLYYFENYIAKKIEKIQDLLEQTKYQQEFMPLDENIKQVNGVNVVSNLPYILSNRNNIEILERNEMKEEKL